MNDREAAMNMENKCPQCGAELPAGGLAGLCPACMLKQAAAETASQPGFAGFQPPSVAELAKLFPQLEIISLIGRGGMGAVYKARQPLLDRIVAIKILPAQVTRGTDFADRFTREARALAKLHHPNIVMVYDFGQMNGQPYFIMEYVDGVNLRQLEQEGKLSPVEALQIVPQICEALQFAHDAGIVHRDIKPDNILVDKKGRVKIADFGIAKLVGANADPAIPVTQGSIGTPHYMAPEQVDRPQSVDHRADIFSLGVVFYEMLTGELPLGKFAPPSSGPRGLRVDVRLDEVVFRALEREPDRRYQHASQVKTAVETIAGTLGPSAPGTPHSGPTPEAVLARDYSISVHSCVNRGWALVKSDFWPLVGITALILALMAVASSTFAASGSANSNSFQGFSVLALLLNGPLVGGLYLYFLKRVRKEPATVETAFSGFSKRFLHLFLANFVMTALTVLGFLCFVLPGIYLAVAWIFTLWLIMDKGMDFWPAMELSRKMVHKHWWKLFLLLIVFAILMFAGFLACVAGGFVAAPVVFAALAYAYEDVFGVRSPAPTAKRPAAQTIAITPEAFGPAGTLVVPNAGAAPAGAAAAGGGVPPKIGGNPPPAGGVPPAGGPPLQVSPPAPSGGSRKWWVVAALACLLLLLVVTAVVAFLPSFGFHVGRHRVVHNFGTANIHEEDGGPGGAPPPPPVPESPPLPRSPANLAFSERLHQELAKNSFAFVDFTVASTSDSNLMVTFTGLQKDVPDTNTMSGGFVVSNEDAVVSISPTKGVVVTDKKRKSHTTISVGGFHFGDGDDHDGDGQAIAGALTGALTVGGAWKFAGTGQLTPVGFTITNLDVQALLAAPGPSGSPAHDVLNERMDAAETISDTSAKNNLLATLVQDAAKAGDVEIVKAALSKINDPDAYDTAAHDAAGTLNQAGMRKEAIAIAKGIHDTDIRDKVLTELAQ